MLGTCNMQCEVDVFGHSPAVTIAGSGLFPWCAGRLRPWCANTYYIIHKTLLTTCLIICVWVLFSILCFYWQWQGCGALSILSSSSQGQRLHSASVRVSTWSMDVRQLTGSNLCKRGQVSDLIYIYYIQILFMFKTDPEIAIHKFLLVSKAWLNHKPL